eukprot:538437-Karenia_brevis.AAC.1
MDGNVPSECERSPFQCKSYFANQVPNLLAYGHKWLAFYNGHVNSWYASGRRSATGMAVCAHQM